MVGCHHWLNGHVFEQTPEDSEGQSSLVCCSSWDHKGSDKTECWTTTATIFQLLNWVLIIKLRFFFTHLFQFGLVFIKTFYEHNLLRESWEVGQSPTLCTCKFPSESPNHYTEVVFTYLSYPNHWIHSRESSYVLFFFAFPDFSVCSMTVSW